MRTMHIFAGHGGGLLADLILGHRPVIAVEWDRYACQVLRERAADGWFPDLRVWEGDVRLFDPSEYAGRVDCIHAGFPCQDISVAGNQAGIGEGTRSGLYREVIRIAGAVRPRYIFLENVAAIVSIGLGPVLADLAALGYDCRWTCLRASDCGAAHHRDRWWLLAYSNGDKRGAGGLGQNAGTDRRDNAVRVGEVFPDSGSNRCGNGKIQHIDRQRQPSANACNDGASCNVADTTNTGIYERRGFDGAGEGLRFVSGNEWDGLSSSCNQESEILADTDSAQRQGNECAKRVGAEYPDISGAGWWEVEPGLGRLADGIPNRVGQLKGYGNAQVPLQAATAWRLLGGC